MIEGEFTPEECHILLTTPFASASPLVLNTDHPDELFEQAPLVASTLCYLRMLSAREPLKLTQRGHLPRRFLAELFAAGAISEPNRRFHRDQPPVKEADSQPASLLHLIGDQAELTRKQNGKLHLTRRGRSFAAGGGTAGALYRHLFEWHVTSYNWACEDRLPESQRLQAGFWYGLYLLQQYGDEKRPAEFYTDRYLSAFPTPAEDLEASWGRTPAECLAHACEMRLLSAFATHFGLAVVEEAEGASRRQLVVRAGPLLHELVEWRSQDVESAEGVQEGVVAGPWQVDGPLEDVGADLVGPPLAAGTGEEWSDTGEEEAEAAPYDAAIAPDPDEWLALADDDRVALVRDYHDDERAELPNAFLHATFHVVVETQLACADPPEVVETMARLRRQGLDRHDALHAISSELARMMHSAVHEPTDTPDATQAYVGGLKTMTAAKWRANPK